MQGVLYYQEINKGGIIMRKTLNWAVLGTGVIANEMAQALQAMGRELYAVGNRTHSKAVAFGHKYNVQKVYADFNQMFSDPEVDVIYITTPHNTHIEFLTKALSAGKHVLCEKSITLNSRELARAMLLAEQNQVVLAEAMTIWHMPLYKQLWYMLQQGKFGKVQMIQVNFGSFKEYDMQNRFFNMHLAGGALLDIGVYALSLARSFMASQPDNICSQVRYAPTGADEQAGILLMNKEGQMAALSLSLHAKQPKRAVISCEKGYIEILEYPRADRAIFVDGATGAVREIVAGKTADALQYELLDMEKAIAQARTVQGHTASLHNEFTRLADTAAVMEIMTRLRKEWGMQYPGEQW